MPATSAAEKAAPVAEASAPAPAATAVAAAQPAKKRGGGFILSAFRVIEAVAVAAAFAIAAASAYRIRLYAVEEYGRGEGRRSVACRGAARSTAAARWPHHPPSPSPPRTRRSHSRV